MVSSLRAWPTYFTVAHAAWILASISSCSDSTKPNDDDAMGAASSGGTNSGATASGGEQGAPVSSTGGAQASTGGAQASTGGADDSMGGADDSMGGAEDSDNDDEMLPPALTDLTVQGGAVPMWPAFSPEVRRYAVRVADPQESLVVTATADSDFEVVIAGTPLEPDDVSITLSDATADTTFEVSVEDADGVMVSYEVVVLPNDFQDFVVTTLEPGASSDPIYLSPSLVAPYMLKLDNHGVPLFYRTIGSSLGDFKRHPDGRLSYAINQNSGERVLLNEDGETIESIKVVGRDITDIHDFAILENGNYVLIARDSMVRDLTEFGGPVDQAVFDAYYQEVTPQGELVFEWGTWGNVRYDDAYYLPTEWVANTVDYSHANALDIDEDGNWLLSLRHYSAALKLNRQSGEIMWTLGGKDSDFTFVNDPHDGFCAQHSPVFVGENRILLFDNGYRPFCEVPRGTDFSRAVEYELDEVNMTATMVWSYEGPYAYQLGSVQRLSNGNTLIGWGSASEKMATEVDQEGNVVFELTTAGQTAVSYRAVRYPE